MRPTLGEQGRDTWTFGQVMAFLVIFAPLITLVEGYVKGMSTPCLLLTSPISSPYSYCSQLRDP